MFTPNVLTKVFNDSGLSKYWFPVWKMPKYGQDWPLVRDMVANSERLLAFTSIASKEQSEGIAYEWNYIVENQYGDAGMNGTCINRAESSPLVDKTKFLVLMNYFPSIPVRLIACVDNSGSLKSTTETCYTSAGYRWANFLAVDYYKRSEGGGSLEAVDTLNGKLLCGHGDVWSCTGSEEETSSPEAAPGPFSGSNKSLSPGSGALTLLCRALIIAAFGGSVNPSLFL